MFLYYLVLFFTAIIFYFLLSRQYSLTRQGLFLIVFWVFFVSAIFPGVLSYLPFQYSLLILFFLALSGGSLFYHRLFKEISAPKNTMVVLQEEKHEKSPSPKQQEKKSEESRRGAVLIQRDDTANVRRKEALLMDTQEIVHDILERAFKAKEGGDYNRAIQLFHTVLKKSEELSIRGIILSEMISLFKKQGTYLEGAKTIDEFLEREKGLRPSLEEHFHSLSRYLRRLDELLTKAQCPGIPYDQVSALIRTRAENMLKEN